MMVGTKGKAYALRAECSTIASRVKFVQGVQDQVQVFLA